MRIYLELTESSFYDDFVNRIAYQMDQTVHFSQSDTDGNEYHITLKTPDYIPTDLTSTELLFTPVVSLQDGSELSDIPITTTLELERLPSNVSMDTYINAVFNGDNSFTLSRKRLYLLGDLVVTCEVKREDSPTGEPFSMTFKMVTRRED